MKNGMRLNPKARTPLARLCNDVKTGTAHPHQLRILHQSAPWSNKNTGSLAVLAPISVMSAYHYCNTMPVIFLAYPNHVAMLLKK